MIRSMTGFGRNTRFLTGVGNSRGNTRGKPRYYEFTAKLPRNFMYLEDKLKTLVQENQQRKVESA